MKKILAMMLTAAMMLSMGTAAMAEIITEGGQDLSGVVNQNTTFTKAYTVNKGTAPAEDFEFEVEYKYFKNNEGQEVTASAYPTVTLGKASFENNMEANTEAYTEDATVTITDYQTVDLGVYVYEITEDPGTTAGVNYLATPVYLVLTILRDEASANQYVAAIHYTSDINATNNKIGETNNSYDAGKLTVTKQIKGNMADMEKEFTFTIVLTAAEGRVFNDEVQNIIDNTGVTTEDIVYNTDKTSVTITVALGDGDSININNIPAGTTYTVSEDAEGYDSSSEYSDTAETKTISANDEDTVTFTNKKTSEVDTGISVDSIPYIAMLGVVAVGGAGVVVSKKRRSED